MTNFFNSYFYKFNKSISIKYLIAVFLSFSVTFNNYAQKKEEISKTTRILFILDASGSMLDKWEGRTRMAVAKEVLTKIVDSLKGVERLELALRVYGHQWDKRYNNCKDTKLEVPFKKGNHESIKAKIKTIKPQGTTLISYSLEQCGNDFPTDINSRNVIILITDGIEACGGDPCALSLALQEKRIFLKPFIIGIGPDELFKKAFGCMGQYFDAQTVNSFHKVMENILTQTLKETTVRVNLLDINNNPTETNVNITFLNNATNDAEYDFVHYLNAAGQTDNLKIDAILSYDIIVNTIPKVIKKNVKLEGGKENIINIKSPQGSLIVQGNLKEYKNPVVLIRQNSDNITLNVQHIGSKEKYLVGNYDIEVLTLPRTNFKNVKIDQSKLTTLSIESPGILNISESISGYGSLYELKPNGDQEWICNLEDQNSKLALAMQPGKYKIVFRSKKSLSSSYTYVKLFEIKTGATTNLKLY